MIVITYQHWHCNDHIHHQNARLAADQAEGEDLGDDRTSNG